MKLRKFKRLSQPNSVRQQEGLSIYCSALFAAGGTAKWAGKIRLCFDTGAEAVLLSWKILKALGLGNLPVVEQRNIVTASGEIVMADIVLLDVRLLCEGIDERFALCQVPCLVIDGEDVEPLMGMAILQFYRCHVEGGQLTVFRPIPELFGA